MLVVCSAGKYSIGGSTVTHDIILSSLVQYNIITELLPFPQYLPLLPPHIQVVSLPFMSILLLRLFSHPFIIMITGKMIDFTWFLGPCKDNRLQWWFLLSKSWIFQVLKTSFLNLLLIKVLHFCNYKIYTCNIFIWHLPGSSSDLQITQYHLLTMSISVSVNSRVSTESFSFFSLSPTWLCINLVPSRVMVDCGVNICYQFMDMSICWTSYFTYFFCNYTTMITFWLVPLLLYQHPPFSLAVSLLSVN